MCAMEYAIYIRPSQSLGESDQTQNDQDALSF